MATILVVDDDEDMRVSLSNILETDNHNVITASNGKMALDKLQNESPDMVLLDVRMPGMDGIQTLEQIKKIRKETK